jgi:hypothetical protein
LASPEASVEGMARLPPQPLITLRAHAALGPSPGRSAPAGGTKALTFSEATSVKGQARCSWADRGSGR